MEEAVSWDESLQLLLVDDAFEREAAAQALVKRIEALGRLAENDMAYRQEVLELMPTVGRLAHECPFVCVRDLFKELEQKLVNSFCQRLPDEATIVSRFLPSDAVPPIDEVKNARILNWFEDLFLVQGRVSHLDRVIALLPGFADAFYATYFTLMKQAGPLPLTWRNFLGVIASARYSCTYLVALCEHEFLASGGDPSWLSSVVNIPPKLKSIYKLNALLAHQPWLITQEHIEEVVKGNDAWSLSELMHCIMILSMYHGLSGLVIGLGLRPEIDWKDNVGLAVSSGIPDDPQLEHNTKFLQQQAEATRNLAELLQSSDVDLLIKVQTGADAFDSIVVVDEATDATSSSGRCVTQSTSTSAPSSQALQAHQASSSSAHDSSIITIDASRYKRVLGNVLLEFKYVNYDVKSTMYKVFRMQDYNWKDHAYSLMARYYQGVAPLFDEELAIIYDMTDNSVYEERGEIDTGPFRRAIWHYVHRLFGICHDAYEYELVNIFLNRSIKIFLKKVTCLVEPVTHRDVLTIGYKFRPDEVVHITLLAIEAKRRAAILYALRAMTKFSSS